MVLSKTPRWFYLLVAFLGLLVLALGVWWLYLITVFARMMGPGSAGVLNMVKWEGTTFLLLIMLAAIGVALLYWRDLKKTRALQALFASLTHELKTPLASMRLQAEVIRDMIADENHDHSQLTGLTTRLIQDTAKFEHELDKGLQLSRIEQGGSLTLVPVDLTRLVKKLSHKYDVPLEVHGEAVVLADEMALTMIFRNLFENSRRHNPDFKSVRLTLSAQAQEVRCHYDDQGPAFEGDRKKLGTLFYKHKSQKGTGIGLYLIEKLMLAQQGLLRISQQGALTFTLHFRRAEELP